MVANNAEKKLKTIRIYLIVFMVLLILSGLSAVPIVSELDFLCSIESYFPPFVQNWLNKVDFDAHHTSEEIFYGTDWLAFAHVAIAIAFIGPVKDPVKNIWVIQFGMIISILVLPMAFISGSLRHIPLFHQLIDCSFGVFALIPLGICYKKTIELEKDLSLNETEFIYQ